MHHLEEPLQNLPSLSWRNILAEHTGGTHFAVGSRVLYIPNMRWKITIS